MVNNTTAINDDGIDDAGRPILLRALGPGMAAAIVVGNVIGSGIFVKPGTIAATGGSFPLIISLWLLGGLICVLGALCFAELAVMLPQAGGHYVYLREAYGRPVAFLFGWNEFLFARPASIGALSWIFTGALSNLLDWKIGIIGQMALALAAIALIAWINVLGVLWGARVQTAMTIIKAGFVAFVALLPFVLLLGGVAAIDPYHYQSQLTDPPARPLIERAGIVLLAILWAYNGWHGVTPVAEEIKNPQRNIPIALFGGIGILMLLYLSANVAYHGVLSMDELKATGQHAAEHVVRHLLGPFGGKLMSVGIMCSTFGAICSNLLISPRVPFAMGRDGVFFRPLGWVHANYRSPATAIIVQSVMATILILASGVLVVFIAGFRDKNIFDMLTDFVIFAESIFYLLAVLAVLVLRRTRPDWHRPYKTWGYPVVPIAYVLFYFWFLAQVYMGKPFEAKMGLLLIGLGLPVYFAYQRWGGKKPRESD